jgi:hypothetical protein
MKVSAGKPMGPASAYLVGFENGPIKVGVTSGPPAKRIFSARRQSRSSDVAILGSWPHKEAYLIEKLSHMYMMKHHISGEWFSVGSRKAKTAIKKVISLLASPRGAKDPSGNYLQRRGFKEEHVLKCFGARSEIVTADWNRTIRADWNRVPGICQHSCTVAHAILAETDERRRIRRDQLEAAEERSDRMWRNYWRRQQYAERKAKRAEQAA